MKKQSAVILLAVMLFALSAGTNNAAQKRGRSAAVSRQPLVTELGGVTKAPTFDEPTFRAKLKGMLDEMKSPPATSRTNEKAIVEFLYFNSCPGHQQALINLKAALQENKIRADLRLINVTSEAQAAKVGFQGSPSIRVNGKDLDGRNEGHSYGCRIYQIGGKITPTPSKEFIQEKLRELMPKSTSATEEVKHQP